MDHVSDAFLDNLMPLLILCEPAQTGNRNGVERVAPQFMQHAANMQKVTILYESKLMPIVLMNFCKLGCSACLLSV